MQQTANVIDSVHNLENAGMNRSQAETLTRLVHDSIAEALEPVVRNMATKSELAEFKVYVTQHMATKEELAELKAYMMQHMATKEELTELKAYMTQHMVTKAELAEFKVYMTQHMATKSELAGLRTQISEVRTELKAHVDAQIALLRGEINEKMGTNLKYIALTVGFSTVAIIAAIFAAPLAGG